MHVCDKLITKKCPVRDMVEITFRFDDCHLDF